MNMNEDVHKMRAQILNLRSAAITCATAVHYFPRCVRRPEDYEVQFPEAKFALQPIYEGMKDLLLSARMALTAVLNPNPEGWDFLAWLSEQNTCAESDMAKFGETIYSDQDEYIKFFGEMDANTAERFGTGFSDEEWARLTADVAWQSERRLPQILRLLKYLEDQIAKQFDLFDSVLCSGLLGDCDLGRWADEQKASRF